MGTVGLGHVGKLQQIAAAGSSSYRGKPNEVLAVLLTVDSNMIARLGRNRRGRRLSG